MGPAAKCPQASRQQQLAAAFSRQSQAVPATVAAPSRVLPSAAPPHNTRDPPGTLPVPPKQARATLLLVTPHLLPLSCTPLFVSVTLRATIAAHLGGGDVAQLFEAPGPLPQQPGHVR